MREHIAFTLKKSVVYFILSKFDYFEHRRRDTNGQNYNLLWQAIKLYRHHMTYLNPPTYVEQV